MSAHVTTILTLVQASMFPSTKIRRFLAGEGTRRLEIFGRFRCRKDQSHEFPVQSCRQFHWRFKVRILQCFSREITRTWKNLKYAIPKLSEIPLKKTVFRKSYTPLPIKVEKLTMFMEFADPENLASSPFFITGVLNFKWNSQDYPKAMQICLIYWSLMDDMNLLN